MKHYIIKFSKDWADEFDYEEVFLCTREKLKEVQDRVKELEDEYIYITTLELMRDLKNILQRSCGKVYLY